jgi:hypothetical protein
MSLTSEFLEVSLIFYKRGQSLLNLLLRLINVTTGCVETTCDAVFDETNGSQKEQVDLNLVDNKEALCDALQRMVIGNVMLQDPSNQPQEISPNDITPPA